MKVLILGATGHVGKRLAEMLVASDRATVIAASRRAASPSATPAKGIHRLQLDTLDAEAMHQAVSQADAVVNCVAGDGRSIGEGASVLAQAIKAQQRPVHLVHMSSMAVYGAQEGLVDESAPLDPTLGWYAKAKCDAEAHLSALNAAGHPVTIFRPGCVYGPGSTLWVERTARLLLARRLGDLGATGDGWSNLVHVDDVCRATQAALQRPHGPAAHAYNLADPASPRWNQYFADLALHIGAVPLKRISTRKLKGDAIVASPFFKVLEKLSGKVGLGHDSLPVPISPSLLKLWPQQIRLDSRAAHAALQIDYVPYARSLQESVRWLKTRVREKTP